MQDLLYCNLCNTQMSSYNKLGNSCSSCNSVFSKTLPSVEELLEYYATYNIKYHGGGSKSGSESRQMKYALKYFNVVKKYSSGKTLIDIGSSTNPFPNIAHSMGYLVSVMDYVKPVHLNPEIVFIKSSIENYEASEQHFDIVTAFAVIEHTRDPFSAIKNIINLCKLNGTIIIYIPEIGRFPDNYSLGTSNWFYPPEHLNLLSSRALIKIMDQNDCELITYKRFELTLIRYIIRYGIGIFEGIAGFLVKSILGRNLWIKIRQKRKSKYQGLSMFVFKKFK